jgi:hypothetical protein
LPQPKCTVGGEKNAKSSTLALTDSEPFVFVILLLLLLLLPSQRRVRTLALLISMVEAI